MKTEILEISKIDQSKLCSINEFLKIFSKFGGGEGVILWELNQETEYLSVVGHTFDSHYSFNSLPFNFSETGKAIREGKPIYKPNLNEGNFPKFQEKV